MGSSTLSAGAKERVGFFGGEKSRFDIASSWATAGRIVIAPRKFFA
jgi:hypothetical protein